MPRRGTDLSGVPEDDAMTRGQYERARAAEAQRARAAELADQDPQDAQGRPSGDGNVCSPPTPPGVARDAQKRRQDDGA